MEKKSKFGSLISGAGKAAKDLLDKSKEMAVKVTDQNDDGKFDMEDVSAIAGSVSDAVKNKLQSIKDSNEKRKLEKELAELRPIFRNADTGEFRVPKFFRVVERDKRRAESKVCEGSVGYLTGSEGEECVNLFEDSIIDLGIEFDAVGENDFYFRNPTASNRYIGIKVYFDFLETVRIMELTQIAQKLGAKSFEVTYVNEERRSEAHGNRASAKMALFGSAKVSTDSLQRSSSSTEISVKQSFTGHDPVMPELRYLAGDPQIQNLIAQRMDPDSPLQEQVLRLKISDSIGITEKEAVKIDTVVAKSKVSSEFSMSKQMRNESLRLLVYHIVF